MKKKLITNNSFSEFLLYTTPNGKVKVEIFLRDENIWLTQAKIAELFGVGIPAINKHLKNIFEGGELIEDSVISKMETTAGDGKAYTTMFYNLDAILSVGYRVNSSQATQFRIWATERLREYIIKGFTMDDERLKDPYGFFGHDYFEEQLARIRNIRASERRMSKGDRYLRVVQCRLRSESRNHQAIFRHRLKQTALCDYRQNCRGDYSSKS